MYYHASFLILHKGMTAVTSQPRHYKPLHLDARVMGCVPFCDGDNVGHGPSSQDVVVLVMNVESVDRGVAVMVV